MQAKSRSETELLFLGHISDLCKTAALSDKSVYTRFLTEAEQDAAGRFIKSNRDYNAPHKFFGGYEDAERLVLGVGADLRSFPITALTFSFTLFDGKDRVSHRDILGAALNLSISRELIGDILVGEDFTVMFCLESAADIITRELTKIGRVGVRIEQGTPRGLPPQSFEIISASVKTPRLDSVVAESIGFSREKAQALIKSGAVKLKGTAVFDADRQLLPGTAFTVAGHGKFMLEEIGHITKKGRIHIQIKRFK